MPVVDEKRNYVVDVDEAPTSELKKLVTIANSLQKSTSVDKSKGEVNELVVKSIL